MRSQLDKFYLMTGVLSLLAFLPSIYCFYIVFNMFGGDYTAFIQHMIPPTLYLIYFAAVFFTSIKRYYFILLLSPIVAINILYQELPIIYQNITNLNFYSPAIFFITNLLTCTAVILGVITLLAWIFNSFHEKRPD